MSAAAVPKLTDATWEDRVLGARGPVLVDFWAPWCVPCERVSPLVRALGERLAGRLTVGALNVEDHPRTAGRYDILALPTLILFKDGAPVERISGPISAARLERAVTPHLDPG